METLPDAAGQHGTRKCNLQLGTSRESTTGGNSGTVGETSVGALRCYVALINREHVAEVYCLV